MSTALRELNATESVAALDRALQAAREARAVVHDAKDALRLAREQKRTAVPIAVLAVIVKPLPKRIVTPDFVAYDSLPPTYDCEGYRIIWSGTVGRKTGKSPSEVGR